PAVLETTAVGAAYLAGLQAGLCAGPGEFAASWRSEHQFQPKMDADERDAKYAGWKDAVSRTLSR
ncbi:MAG: glycerol kinase, partial [Rhizobiales bacterium]|nr:glycerol kinase [Hyphomicrobiales bacterium]